jgi:PPOX class probable F420-dependent enzyme
MFEMAPNEIEEFLSTPRHAVVGTNRPDGAPQLSPVWFLHEGGLLYVGTERGSAKHRNLMRDDRISLCIVAGHPDARAVIVHGRAEILEADSPGVEEIRWRLIRLYKGSDEEARRHREMQGDVDSVMLRITAERIISHDFNNRLEVLEEAERDTAG